MLRFETRTGPDFGAAAIHGAQLHRHRGGITVGHPDTIQILGGDVLR